MAAVVKIDPIEKLTTVSLVKSLSEPEQRRIAGRIARQDIEWAKQVNRQVLGRIPPYFTTVDGRQGAPLESVRLNGGQVITEFELIGDLLVWIMTTLIERSPHTSGEYKRGHRLFADGQEVDPTVDPSPAINEFVFLNIVPYARRLEVGKTKSGRDFLIQVPNRIYERTARDARSRFGNVASIKSVFREPLGGYRLKYDQPTRRFNSDGSFFTERKQRSDRVKGTQIQVPAILITFRNR